MTIKQKLNALRILMKEKKIDAYLVPTDDFHGSEYVGDYFKCRKYITGFTGSAGTAIITQDMAGLWTDGRYFIQAADQLRDTTIELFKSGEPGVPTVHQFLNDKLEEGMCLGFDGRTVSAREAEELQELLQEKHITFSVNDDLIGEIWEDRPVLSCEPVMELDVRWTGKSRADKIAEIREQMKAKEADTFILTSLDDIAWLLNIRGNDIHCCPVVLSYLVMMENELRLYANAAAFSEEIRSNLEADGVKIYPYDDVYSYVQSISSDKKVLLSRANVNSRLVSNIPSEVTILDEPNLTLLPKAVKNKTEMENKIATFTGGRAAEELIFGEITTGASNDIEQATKFARAMITRYGMNEEFDMVAMESVSNQYLGGDSSLTCSMETQTLIDQKVVQLVKEQHQKAKKILEDNVMKLHEIAKFLYEHETITGEEFMEILNSDSQKIIEEKQQ